MSPRICHCLKLFKVECRPGRPRRSLIAYRAPLPLVGNMAESMVAGACLHAYLLEVELR